MLGELLKIHGISGHLVLKLAFFTEEELNEGDTVFVEVDGIPVPFFIAGFRFLTDYTALIKFDEIETAAQAGFLAGCRVLSSRDFGESNGNREEGYSDIVGFRVFDRERGYTGILLEVVEYPDNPVMRIEFEDREVLIPFHEDLIERIDIVMRVIEISAPGGLLDLYL